MTTPDPAPARPPAAEAERRAAREARRELAWAKRDAEYAEYVRADQRIDEAAAVAVEVLPDGVGTAVAALLGAMKPFRASDGHMSVSAIGRSSPEVLALAEALLAAQPPPPASEAERVLAGLVAMHFNTDEVIHHSSFRHVQVEAMWEHARQVVEAAQQRLTERDRGREL